MILAALVAAVSAGPVGATVSDSMPAAKPVSAAKGVPAGQGYRPSAAAKSRLAPPKGEEAIVLVRPPADQSGAELDAAAQRIDRAIGGADLATERELPEVGAASVDLTRGQSVGELRRELAGDPAVVGVERNVRLELRYRPDDPAFATPDAGAPQSDIYQWHLRDSFFHRAWNRSRGGRAQVAVIDTGADAAHPDLKRRIVASFDRDDYPFHAGSETDESGHGTHVSGLACGNGDNGYGIASAGFRCDLTIYKSDLSLASIADSIVDAADRGVDVLNMSFGGEGSSQLLRQAIDRAWRADVVMVAAAANEDTAEQGIPARYLQPKLSRPKIKDSSKGLVVTAAERGGRRAWFSPGRGSGVSLAAYGAASESHFGIFSSFPAELTEIETIDLCSFCRGSFDGDDRFAYLEGTSMATPQVAGAAALIRHKRPGMSARRIIRLIKRHAIRDGGFSETLGWGILNANKPLKKVLKKSKRRKRRG